MKCSKKLGENLFSGVSDNAKVFIYPDATGFVETFEGLPVEVLMVLRLSFLVNPAINSKLDSTQYLVQIIILKLLKILINGVRSEKS